MQGGPLLLLELAFLLRNVGAQVIWVTYQKPVEENEVIHSLEHKMINRGVQVLSAKGQETINTALKADMIVLNTAVTGKWLDFVLKKHLSQVLPKILWWIHEMRGHYFKLDYIKNLPFVAAAMIDSKITTEYWKNRTHERLGNYSLHFSSSISWKQNYRKNTKEALQKTEGDNTNFFFFLFNPAAQAKGRKKC